MKTDAELVAAALAGGPQAFGPIIERYRDAVFGVALARLGDFHEAEDTAQEVFVEAFGALDGLKDPNRLGAWLRSVTIHKAIDRLRQKRETGRLEEAGQCVGDASTPDAVTEQRELRDRVLAAIGRLSKVQRETTTLYYVNGYSVEEVAGIQEVPAGTIKRRLYDARERLKEEMIGVVEEVLKSEAPKEDFGERVVAMLNLYQRERPNWAAAMAKVKGMGADAIPGLMAALDLPHWQSRRFAAQVFQMVRHNIPPDERIVELLKGMISDSNKKLRKHGAYLLSLDVDEERKRTEFLPLVVPLLADRSAQVRWRTAYELRDWAADLPLEEVAEALANEKHPRVRSELAGLVRRIVATRREKNQGSAKTDRTAKPVGTT